MPFGNESAWDSAMHTERLVRTSGCHQCLSAMSPLGTKNMTNIDTEELWGHQCLSAMSPLGTKWMLKKNIKTIRSPMPFGNESAWDLNHFTKPLAAPSGHQCLSAMSPLGTARRSKGLPMWRPSHQCLSAMSPLGTAVQDTEALNLGLESPMPFGNESAWDRKIRTEATPSIGSHQCLSAMSPLGTG